MGFRIRVNVPAARNDSVTIFVLLGNNYLVLGSIPICVF